MKLEASHFFYGILFILHDIMFVVPYYFEHVLFQQQIFQNILLFLYYCYFHYLWFLENISIFSTEHKKA